MITFRIELLVILQKIRIARYLLNSVEVSNVHSTIVTGAITPLSRTSGINKHKNNARSRLFCRITKRSIIAFYLVFWKDVREQLFEAFTKHYK